VDKYLVLGMEWCVPIISRRRQLPDVLCDVNVFYLSLSTATNELHECIMYKAVLILHTDECQQMYDYIQAHY